MVDMRVVYESIVVRMRAVLALWLMAALLAGCAAPSPVASLHEYHAAIAAAREVSEAVLLEAGIVWEHAERTRRQVTEASETSPHWLRFDPDHPRQRRQTVDEQIEVRLQFWTIAERYNLALIALAEGRPPGEVRHSVNGFADALRSLPWRRLATVGGTVGALSGLLSETLTIIEDHIAASRFREALRAGAPLLDSMFELLIADVSDFHDMHLVRHQQQRRAIDRDLQFDLLPSFASLYTATGPSEEKSQLLIAVRRVLKDDLGYAVDQLPDHPDPQHGNTPYQSEHHAQLLLLKREIARLGERGIDLDATMQHSNSLHVAYHELLEMTRRHLQALVRAAAGGEHVPREEMLIASLAVSRELIRYRQGAIR